MQRSAVEELRGSRVVAHPASSALCAGTDIHSGVGQRTGAVVARASRLVKAGHKASHFTFMSLSLHFTFISLSLHFRFTFISLSFHFHVRFTFTSLPFHLHFTSMLPFHFHSTLISLSLHFHFTSTSLSFHSSFHIGSILSTLPFSFNLSIVS